MRHMTNEERVAAEDKGERAENVAAWYFRLNGFLSIPGFIVHRDNINALITEDGTPIIARTEADFMGVRFLGSREEVNGRSMQDDPKLLNITTPNRNLQALFILVEVKAGLCRMNGPWSRRENRNMERVIRRLGFAANENQVTNIAAAMYDQGHWEGEQYAFQYICVGRDKNPELEDQFSQLVQIDWRDIARFLFDRFKKFPEKLPSGLVHEQWPDFGYQYGVWFSENQRNLHSSVEAVRRYIDTGTL